MRASSDADEPTGTPAATEPAASPPPAASWQSRPAEAPWCPPAVADAFPWAAAHDDREDVTAATATPPWRLLAASRRGRVHAHHGTHREDAVACASGPWGWVMAVADGAGSAEWSRVGAAAACRAAVASVVTRQTADASSRAMSGSTASAGAAPEGGRDSATRAMVVEAAHAAVGALDEIAATAALPPRSLRTTLLVAVMDRGAEHDTLAVTQVGDGGVLALGADGTVRLVGEGDGGAYSGEVSCFLPDEGARQRADAAATVLQWDVAAVVLCTDGIEDPFYPLARGGVALLRQLRDGVDDPLPGFRQEARDAVLDAPDPSGALLAWMGFEKRGENDDRSLAIAWRAPMPMPVPVPVPVPTPVPASRDG